MLLKNSKIKFSLIAKTLVLITSFTFVTGFVLYNVYDINHHKFLENRNKRDLDFKVSNIQKLRNSNLTGKNQVVVIIDTFIDKSHNEIKDKIIKEKCFSSSGDGFISLCEKENAKFDNFLNDYNHGTAVSSIISGKYGIAPKSKIISINPYSLDKNDKMVIQPKDRINTLNYVLDLVRDKKYNISVINLSWNTDFSSKENCDNKYTEEARIINEINEQNVFVIASTGNDGKKGETAFPACLSNVIKVGSLDNGLGGTEQNQISKFSNYNEKTFFAPGKYLKIARGFKNDKDRVNITYGTSFATGAVSGAMLACRQKYSKDDCFTKLFTADRFLTFDKIQVLD